MGPHQTLHRRERGDGHRAAGQLLGEEAVGHEVRLGPAVGLRVAEGEVPLLPETPEERARELPGLVERVSDRRHLGVDEAGDGPPELLLLRAQPEVHAPPRAMTTDGRFWKLPCRFTSHLDLGQARQRGLHLLRGVLEVLELARHVALVGGEVEVAVTAEVERDDLPVSRGLAAERLVDDDPDRVGRLGRRQEPFRAREGQRRLEGGVLVDGHRLDHLVVVQRAHQGRHAVVAEAAGVDRRRDEGVAERVHLDQRASSARCRRSRRRTRPW